MGCTCIGSNCTLVVHGCMQWVSWLHSPHPPPEPLFSQLSVFVLVEDFQLMPSPGLLSGEGICLFQGYVLSMGGEPFASWDWLMWGYRHLPLCLDTGRF